MPSHDFSTTPADLPRPTDDGACAHLQNCSVSSIELATTDGSWVNLALLDGLSILFCYPMTGRPGVPLPPELGRNTWGTRYKNDLRWHSTSL